LADISHALVFDALTRAATAPDGLPLFAPRSGPGLFAATAAGKSAAQRCKDEGLLHVLRSESKGKLSQEVCGLTDKGLAFLLQHANPRPVLEAFVAALRDRQGCLEAILDSVRHSQHDLEALRAGATKVLERLAREPQQPPASPWARNGCGHGGDVAAALRAQLTQWHEAGLLGDCPLPELFQRLRPACPTLTIGQFHDELRLLHRAQEIYLHPWTGPLYELPEPALALLVGHEIAYYASLRV
jgi:hypothetical protein